MVQHSKRGWNAVKKINGITTAPADLMDITLLWLEGSGKASSAYVEMY